MRRSHRALRTALAFLIGLGLALVVAVGTASAHAPVVDATPKIDSMITQAPTRITVTTAENMKPGPQSSNLFVYGPDGVLVSQGDATIPLNNPREMSITITPEKNSGIYVVRWITVSAADGDPDQGAFVFTVNPAGTTAAPTPMPTKPATTPTSPAGTSGTSLWLSLIIGFITLLVGLFGGFAFGRRRPAPVASTSSDRGIHEEEKTTLTP